MSHPLGTAHVVPCDRNRINRNIRLVHWPHRFLCRQLRFIRAYLEHRAKAAAEDGDQPPPSAVDAEQQQREEEESMLDEIAVYSLGSHLFWAVWAITNAASSAITFGYWVRSHRRAARKPRSFLI